MIIVIAPFARKLKSGMDNPKNYPYWVELITYLQNEGHHVIQIGVLGENKLVDDFRISLSLKQITELINDCDLWISCDSFLPHLAYHTGKRGIVLWGLSDPLVFGYSTNVNLLKDRKFLRPYQFSVWENVGYNKDAFVSPLEVLAHIKCYG